MGVWERGDRVVLDHTDDRHTRLDPGTEGTVLHEDALGTVHVRWDDGSTLGMVEAAGDRFHRAGRPDPRRN